MDKTDINQLKELKRFHENAGRDSWTRFVAYLPWEGDMLKAVRTVLQTNDAALPKLPNSTIHDALVGFEEYKNAVEFGRM